MLNALEAGIFIALGIGIGIAVIGGHRKWAANLCLVGAIFAAIVWLT